MGNAARNRDNRTAVNAWQYPLSCTYYFAAGIVYFLGMHAAAFPEREVATAFNHRNRWSGIFIRHYINLLNEYCRDRSLTFHCMEVCEKSSEICLFFIKLPQIYNLRKMSYFSGLTHFAYTRFQFGYKLVRIPC